MRELLIHLALLLIMPLWVAGLISRTKAIAAGRQGAPIWQLAFDLAKLLRKGAVYSRTTTWIFSAGPIVGLACVLVAALLAPFHTATGPLGFEGDVIALAYVLGMARFFTMLAALDTGSAFEGMGASREAAFASLAEPALFLALAAVCIPAGSASFAEVWRVFPGGAWLSVQPQLVLAAFALFAALLAENSRIPVDDPNTHLELTMIHEVMVLDHSGPEFAFIQYGSALKLLIFESLVLHVLMPFSPDGSLQDLLHFVLGVTALSITVGAVESFAARLRLSRVPQFLIGASMLGAVGLLIGYVGGLQ